MKKVILSTSLIISLFFALFVNAQNWINNLPQDKIQNNQAFTFYEIQDAFNAYWDPLNVENGYYFENGVKGKASGWKQFKRWEWYWESRIDPTTGEFPNTSAAEIRQQIRKTSGVRNADGNWQSMGPSTTAGGYAGLGRLNCIAFVDGDDDRFYVGSPSGGLWKTTDGGTTWEVKTDDNDVLGVSDAFVLAGTSASTDTVYIGTGDRDGGSMWSLGGDQYHDNNTIGVLKSVDGGMTWTTTDLIWPTSHKKTINRLLKHPGMNDSIYAAGTDGVFLTTDGGATWPIIPGTFEFIDMEFKPMDPGILYGSTKSGLIFKSGDKGTTWDLKHSIGGAGRIELAVSEDEPGWVYAIASATDGSLEGIHKSTDSGETWTKVFDGIPLGSNLLGYYCDGSGPVDKGQGGYDLCIAADPTDAGTVFIGGVNTWKSIDGGSSWSISNMWTTSGTYNSCGAPNVHADQHALAFQSGSSTLFECNDGGLYKTADGGTTWDYLGSGLIISQLYRLGVSQLSSNTVIAGLQDNGTKAMLSGTWSDVIGGDGMECFIDYTDEDIQYGELNGGVLYRTTDGWSSSTAIITGLTGGSAWVTPWAIDPSAHETIYVGREDVWKSTDKGDTWTKISTLSTGGFTLRSLAIAPSHSDTIYAATQEELFATFDGGTTWLDKTGSLPTGSSNITYISINSDFADTLWVAMGEYNSHGVYQSTDAGATWTSISSGLPLIPVMCVIQNKQNTSDIELYAATDVGVYVKIGSADWMLFSEGLPNVVVAELEIHYNSASPNLSRIRAATYGRGLWQSELFSPAGLAPTTDFEADNTTPVVDENVAFSDLTIDNPDSWFWSFDPATITYVNGTSSTSQNPEVKFTATGSYEVELYTENTNGSDTETKSAYITVTAGSPKYCSANSTGGFGSISRVEFGSIDNTSGYTAGGYADYTAQSTNVSISTSHSLTVTNPYSDTDIDLGVWIDWNQDGDFSDTGEDVVCDVDGGGDGTFSISVSLTAMLGSTRMRLRTKYWPPGCGSPCGTTDNGEVEDYSVYVTAGATTWNGTTSTDWATGSNWSTGIVPSGAYNITIPTSPTGGAVFPVISESTLDATCAGLTIETGASVTINGNLTVDSTLTNSAGVNGLVIGSTATKTGSLLTTTDDVDATVKRYLDGGKWHLVSAPAKSETVESLFFSHDPEVWLKEFEEGSGADGDWGPTITSLSAPMPLGKGFAAWLETGKTGTASFENSINTLDVIPSLSFASAVHGYNLVGNPFTSAIDWDQGGWSKTDLEGSVWVFKSGSGYLTRNSHGLGSLTDGIIPVAQGFFVRTTSGSGSITIPARARVHSSQAYYKNRENEEELNPYFVLIVEEEDNTDEVWVSFCEDCTDGYDNGWDSRKFFGTNNEPQLYTVENDLNLSIDALPTLNADERLIPLNLKAGLTGTHQLKLKDAFDMNETNILLEDLLEETFHDFNINSTYVFEAVKNHPANRFILHLNALATNMNNLYSEDQYSIYTFNKYIYIKYLGNELPGKVQVIDLYGRTIYTNQLLNTNINKIPVNISYGYLIVKIIDDKSITVKKVFVQ